MSKPTLLRRLFVLCLCALVFPAHFALAFESLFAGMENRESFIETKSSGSRFNIEELAKIRNGAFENYHLLEEINPEPRNYLSAHKTPQEWIPLESEQKISIQELMSIRDVIWSNKNVIQQSGGELGTFWDEISKVEAIMAEKKEGDSLKTQDINHLRNGIWDNHQSILALLSEAGIESPEYFERNIDYSGGNMVEALEADINDLFAHNPTAGIDTQDQSEDGALANNLENDIQSLFDDNDPAQNINSETEIATMPDINTEAMVGEVMESLSLDSTGLSQAQLEQLITAIVEKMFAQYMGMFTALSSLTEQAGLANQSAQGSENDGGEYHASSGSETESNPSSSCESPMSAEELKLAEEYVPLHGDMGKFGKSFIVNHRVSEKGHLNKFRVFIPPGAYEVYLDVFHVNDAYEMYTLGRYGQPVLGNNFEYAENGNGSDLEELNNHNRKAPNLDGISKTINYLNYRSATTPKPISESEAGWAYINIEGGRHDTLYALKIVVDIEIYNEWYSSLSSWDEVENAHGMWSCQDIAPQTHDDPQNSPRETSSPCEMPLSAAQINAAEAYIPLYGDQYKLYYYTEQDGVGKEVIGKHINGIGGIDKEFHPKFRIFIPPGTRDFEVNFFMNNDADIVTYSRFGAPPEIPENPMNPTFPLPGYQLGNKGRNTHYNYLKEKTIFESNSDGQIWIANTNRFGSIWGEDEFGNEQYTPLTNEGAGWLYVQVFGATESTWYELYSMINIMHERKISKCKRINETDINGNYTGKVIQFGECLTEKVPDYENWYNSLSSWDEVENAHGMWSCREENTQTLRQLNSGMRPSDIDSGSSNATSSIPTTPTTSNPSPSSHSPTPSTSTGTCQGETPYSDTPFSGGEVLITGPEGSGHWQYKTNPGPNETCWWHCGKDGVRVSGKNACKPHENENQGRTCETPDGTYPEGPRTVSYYYDENKVTYYAACDYGPQSTKGWTLRSVTCPAGYLRVGSGWETKCEQ